MECLIGLGLLILGFIFGYVYGYTDGKEKGISEGIKISGKAVVKSAEILKENEQKWGE